MAEMRLQLLPGQLRLYMLGEANCVRDHHLTASKQHHLSWIQNAGVDSATYID
jgi:hypothetical protein